MTKSIISPFSKELGSVQKVKPYDSCKTKMHESGGFSAERVLSWHLQKDCWFPFVLIYLWFPCHTRPRGWGGDACKPSALPLQNFGDLFIYLLTFQIMHELFTLPGEVCWIFLSCCLDASEECLQMYYAKNKLSQINNNKRMNLKKKYPEFLLALSYLTIMFTSLVQLRWTSVRERTYVDMHSMQPFVVWC